MSPQAKWPLNDGNEMPILGFGLYLTKPGMESIQSIQTALEAGYRHFDTAALYKNESELGKVILQNNIPREDVFITTKLWNADHGYDEALKAFDESLEKLKMDYVDLYLIHWPVEEKRKDSWKALMRIKEEGRAKSIGVSNYTIRHLEELLQTSSEKPVVNQVEFHPFLYQQELLAFCEENKIQLQAYSPLTRGKRLDNPVIVNIAEKYKKTPAQIMLRWSLQHQVVPIVKSATPHRIVENSLIFDFDIAKEDMTMLDSLRDNIRVTWDPTDVK